MNKRWREFFADRELMLGLGGLNLTLSLLFWLVMMWQKPEANHGAQLIAACVVSVVLITVCSITSVTQCIVSDALTERRVRKLLPRVLAIMELDEFLRRDDHATEPTATATPTVAAEPIESKPEQLTLFG